MIERWTLGEYHPMRWHRSDAEDVLLMVPPDDAPGAPT